MSSADSIKDSVAARLPHIPESKEELKAEVKAEAKAVASSGLSQLRSFAAGGFGGICAVVVGHPFDLVKVRLQTAESGVYKSAVDCLKQSIARDGLRRGLYAGVSAPLVGVTPMCMWISCPCSLAPLAWIFHPRSCARFEGALLL